MSRLSQFVLGIKTLFRGFGFLLKHPSLWPWVFIPWIIAILLLAFSWGIFVHYYPDFYQFLLAHVGLQVTAPEHGFWATFGYGALWVLRQILKVILFLLGLILLSIVTFAVTLILSAPFCDILAEKTGILAKGQTPIPFEWARFFKSIGRTITVESQKAVLFLIFPIVFLLFNLIPGVGGLIYAMATCLFGMWALGFVAVDYTLGLEIWTFRQRFQLARQSKFALIGFGLPFLIPFAPLLLQAPMVVGGTLLYHELKEPKPSAYS
ncbi:MAG: EI24 domain-containing protein [Deltaproteobacteria bacterium]|nr:EI24 domain-containing protein [Deltaproteobacteria bacterium]